MLDILKSEGNFVIKFVALIISVHCNFESYLAYGVTALGKLQNLNLGYYLKHRKGYSGCFWNQRPIFR